MSEPHTKPPLPPEIASRLSRLRFYIRAYVCARGLALFAAALVGAFWFTLAVDWLLEPSPPARTLLLIVACFGIGYVLVRQWGLHLLVPLADRNMALLLERRDRRLNDRLLTVVELAGRHGSDAGFDPRMLSHTGDEARAMMDDVRPASVFNYRPLFWALVLMVLSGLSVLSLATLRPAITKTWVQRSLLMGPQRWERDTQIAVDGFPADAKGRRSMKVAIGGDLEIHARADTTRRIPSLLELSYETQDGATLKQNMTMQGTAVPGRDPYQEYIFQFKNVQNSICFNVRARREQFFGKDDTVDDLWIDAVESPDLKEWSLHCKYPPYLKRKDETLPVTGIMSVPEGTAVTVEAGATKDLLFAECQISGQPPMSRKIDVAGGSRRFQLDLGPLRTDTVVLFTLRDTDGVSNRQPMRLQIRTLLDQPPQLDVRFASIGKSITPRALLPLRGTVVDDTLAKTWFEFQTPTEKTPRERKFITPKDGQFTKDTGVGLDVTDLGLKPGGRFFVWVKAADACPLDAAPHVGASPRFDFDVVTEQQLRGILEGTEHALRGRHEAVMDSLKRARDALRRIETDGEGTPAGGTNAATLDGPVVARQSASEAQTQGRGLQRVTDAQGRSTLAAHETLEVAEHFDRILEELENNRVENIEEMRSRIGEKIATPLRTTVREEFPKLLQRLSALRDSLADNNRRPRAAVDAEKQLDVILRQMEQVRAEMLESEDFNKLLTQLRSILQEHENVTRLTRDRQEQLKKELRKGLE